MEENSIGKLIAQYFTTNNKTNLYLEGKAVDLWKEVVGDCIARHTKVTGLSNGVMFVKVDAASLKFELASMRGRLKEELNKQLGVPLITNIIFK